jgi:lysophospholipase L1-like esterase
MRRPFSTWVGLSVVAMTGVLMTIGVMELVLRAVPALLPTAGDKPPASQRVFDPYIGHLHKPHSHAVVEHPAKDFRVVHDTDGYGFRNAWPWPERAEIVAVGDSLTFGYGVATAEAWPSVLARALPGVRLINIGLTGASTPQYLRLYEVYGVPLRPRVLLIGLFLRNDFWDAGLFDVWQRSGMDTDYMTWRDTSGRSSAPSSVSLVASVIRRSRIGDLVHRAWKGYDHELLTYHTADGPVQLDRQDFEEKTAGADASRQEYWLVYNELLRLDRQARRHGTRTVVALLPSKEEVHFPLLGVAFQDPARDLRRALRRDDIDCVDLVPLFRARAAAGRRLFYRQDGHPNAQGYALIAEGVLEHISAHQYLERALSK